MTIREEYNRRIDEINSFFEILNIIELERPIISATNLGFDNNQKLELQINSSKISILRSTTYLLLYNLIESTVYNSILSIFEELEDKGIKYYEVIEDVQRYWIKNLYKHDESIKKDSVINTIMNIATHILNDTINLKSKRINHIGSLDVKKILETADSMKIDINKVRQIYNKKTHGHTFIEIKNNRNWLAHGEKSFIEVGNNITFLQLKESKDLIFPILSEFINSVETYIRQQQYRKQV